MRKVARYSDEAFDRVVNALQDGLFDNGETIWQLRLERLYYLERVNKELPRLYSKQAKWVKWRHDLIEGLYYLDYDIEEIYHHLRGSLTVGRIAQILQEVSGKCRGRPGLRRRDNPNPTHTPDDAFLDDGAPVEYRARK